MPGVTIIGISSMITDSHKIIHEDIKLAEATKSLHPILVSTKELLLNLTQIHTRCLLQHLKHNHHLSTIYFISEYKKRHVTFTSRGKNRRFWRMYQNCRLLLELVLYGSWSRREIWNHSELTSGMKVAQFDGFG